MITHTSGGDPIPAGCEIGTFVPTEDEVTHTINHSLGVVPKLAYCFCALNKSWADTSAGTILVEELAQDPQTGTFDTSNSGRFRNNVVSITNPNTTPSYQSTSTYTTYPADMTSTQVTFVTGRYYSGKFKANETYMYVLIK